MVIDRRRLVVLLKRHFKILRITDSNFHNPTIWFIPSIDLNIGTHGMQLMNNLSSALILPTLTTQMGIFQWINPIIRVYWILQLYQAHTQSVVKIKNTIRVIIQSPSRLGFLVLSVLRQLIYCPENPIRKGFRPGEIMEKWQEGICCKC